MPAARFHSWALATTLALLGSAAAHAVPTASVAFGLQGEYPPVSYSNPVAVAASRHVNNSSLAADFWGSANLADGTVRVKMNTTPLAPYQSSPIAIAGGSITDDLTVVGPGTAPVTITLTMDIDALLPMNVAMGPSSYESLIYHASLSGVGPVAREIRVYRSKGVDENGVVTQNDIICQGDCGLLNQPLSLAGVIDGKLVVQGEVLPNNHFTFWAAVDLQTFSYPIGLYAEIDASQTARMSYSLPDGYTLTSASGVFLTAVPEPSTALLVLAGGLWLVWRARAAAPRTRCG